MIADAKCFDGKVKKTSCSLSAFVQRKSATFAMTIHDISDEYMREATIQKQRDMTNAVLDGFLPKIILDKWKHREEKVIQQSDNVSVVVFSVTSFNALVSSALSDSLRAFRFISLLCKAIDEVVIPLRKSNKDIERVNSTGATQMLVFGLFDSSAGDVHASIAVSVACSILRSIEQMIVEMSQEKEKEKEKEKGKINEKESDNEGEMNSDIDTDDSTILTNLVMNQIRQGIELKVGVASGKVAYALLGDVVVRPSFDVYGIPVNRAAVLAENGKPGVVSIDRSMCAFFFSFFFFFLSFQINLDTHSQYSCEQL